MFHLRIRAIHLLVLLLLLSLVPLYAVYADPPGNFNLTYPVNGHNYPTATMPFPITFTWEPAANATSYTFKLVFGGDLESGPVFVDNIVTTDTFYTLTLPQQAQLAPGALLSWSVKATNDDTGETLTKTANFSVDFSFAPQNFSLTAPANNATVPLTDPFTFTWTASSGSTAYIFNLNGLVQNAITTQTSYILTAAERAQLQPGQSYAWSVAATNGYMGQNLTQSASFSVDYPQPAPQDFNLTYPVHQVQYPSATLPFPITFTWEPSVNATSYTFQLTSSNFVEQTVIVDNAVTTGTSFTLTADQQSQLIPGLVAEWLVTASNGEPAQNRTKTAQLFLYPSDPPGSFNLLAPAENSSYTAATLPNPLTFSWQAAPNASGYVFNLNGAVQNRMTNQTSYTLSEAERNSLLGSGSFEWSVAASNGTFYQNVLRYGHFNITPSPAPQTFNQLTPGDGISYPASALPDPLTFTWSASTNAIGYYFALSDGVVIVPPTFTTQLSYTISAAERAALVPNHTYYWLVKATNGNPAQDLTIDAGFTVTPAQEDAIENAHAISALPFSYSINTSGTTTLPSDPYTVCLPSDQAATSVWFRLEVTENETLVFDTSASDYATVTTVYYSLDPLNLALINCAASPNKMVLQAEVGKTYYVMVNRKINTSEGMLRLTVQALYNPPTLLSPANDAGIIDNPPTLQWEAVPGANAYQVELTRAGSLLPTTYATQNSTSMVLPYTLLETTYSWRVQAFNNVPGTNGNSRYSEARTFTITSLPSAAPSLNLTFDTDYTFTWNVVTWAANYQLEFSLNPNFSDATVYTTTDTWLTSPIDPGLYYWHVCALATGQTTCTSWSPTQTITIAHG